MADPAPGTFIARILAPDGGPAGVGALVSERHVVTCAHVVNAALGRNARQQEQPTGPVQLDFPLLDAPMMIATVERWLPPPREGAAGDDIAGLVLAERAPAGAVAARLAVETPRPGRTVLVFGFPAGRPDGGWAEAAVRGPVASGRLQLDSSSALRVQQGYSGSPVFDDSIGRVAGIVASAPPGRSERDSYAISADRLRLAWPEVLAGPWQRAGGPGRRHHRTELTILHVSDIQFGAHHLFGGNGLIRADLTEDTLFHRLHHDLMQLAGEHGLRPELLVVTGDLAEGGLRSEFQQVSAFLGALSEAAEIPRRHVAIVPGNHDVNRRACAAYFAEQESDEAEPVAPYWPKWRHFAAALEDFYAGTATFTPDEPWTLFEMPDLEVVVAGLNSTMAESHRDGDHYGWTGEHQLAWFARRLANYRNRGWLRLGAVHHNAMRGAATDDENLRDAMVLDRMLGASGLVNLLLHGHTHDAKLHWLSSGLPVLATGSAAVEEAARPGEVPNQYQLITVRRDGFTRHARQYAPGQQRWIGDTRISRTGSDWRDTRPHLLADVDATFPPPAADDEQKEASPDGRKGFRSKGFFASASRGAGPPPSDSLGSEPHAELLGRVAEATRVRFPGATVTERLEAGYLRVSHPLPGGGADQQPVGVIDGPATEATVDAFAERVHARFAAADPSVRSELVYAGAPAPSQLVARARKRGVRLRSLIDYQGLLDLRPLAEAQAERLAADRIYPARLYVPQRYRVASPADGGDVRSGLIDRAVRWLGADDARLVVVLGDFGRGKTSFLRQLTRTLPAELPGLQPVLVELRGLEKAPTLDELLSQYLVRQGVDDISPAKLRYMIHSGRVGLLFDGFDELELRVGYDSAADYLRILLDSVTGHAKVVLTSRTQHFRSTGQVTTALGERVGTLAASRVVVLEDFSGEQILAFLVNLFGDEERARARYELLGGIGNLLELARNPRMLAFVAELEESRLRALQDEEGQVSAAGLYREIIDFWLAGEAERQRYRHGLPSLDESERLSACTALALRLWASKDPTIALADLSAEISATLTGLAERGYTKEQASHSIGSGSLLVRTEDGAFAFVHQSIMEWLVAEAAARALSAPDTRQLLATRRMSRVMAEFFADLADDRAVGGWASQVLSDPEAPEAAKQNALAVMDRLGRGTGRAEQERPNLAGVDLRGHDLNGRDLRGANLRGANLRGMRLTDIDLTGVDLTNADLTGARLIRGSLAGAILMGSRWSRAALLGTEVPADLLASEELAVAAIPGRDPADAMIQPSGPARCVAFSPDSTLLAAGLGSDVLLADATDGRAVRVLSGHADSIWGVAFSPDGTQLATASGDRTTRIWDLITGTTRATLEGHAGVVWGVAFSPDGTQLATASGDRTTRIWDLATGTVHATLEGHTSAVEGVAFSPDGTQLATASGDSTVRIWDLTTGTPAARAAMEGHTDTVYAVAFSPDGTQLATTSGDSTVRIWDLASAATRATLEGHADTVYAVAFSPDGTQLATTSSDSTTRIWDLATGTVHATLEGHTSAVEGVAFSPDGTQLATASDDSTVRIWDLTTGTPAARAAMEGHTDTVYAVAFSPDGTQLATTSTDGTARIWDLTTGTVHATLESHTGTLESVAFSPDGTQLATTSTDGTARIWDLTTGTPAARAVVEGHTDTVRAAAFSPDGTRLATAADDRTVRIWDLTTGTLRATLEGHAGNVWAVAFSPDGTQLATTSSDGTVRIWDLTTSTVHATLEGQTGAVRAMAFSPDGTQLATTSSDGTVRIWDLTTSTVHATLEGQTGAVWAVAFSPDGTQLAIASGKHTARIWDLTTGIVRVTLEGHTETVNWMAFSPDGTRLATASGDGTTRIWDTGRGTEQAVMARFAAGGYAVLTDGGYRVGRRRGR